MSTSTKRQAGEPLGARLVEGGVEFACCAPNADGVDLCLFADATASGTERRLPMQASGTAWRLFVPQLSAGQVYGYRARGPWKPREGHRFNPAKLLVDPCAGAVEPGWAWHPAFLGSTGCGDDEAPDETDSAPWAARSRVVDPAFDWRGVRRPRIPWSDTVLYELHVKGMTALHPLVPAELRGTYLGLVEPAVLEHFAALGVTTIELMPVLQHASERHLAERGRTNYWGYSPIAWQAPHSGYATAGRGDVTRQFKEMVAGLHRAGLEVILDVVFNHTAEGAADGPTWGLRGLDNAAYYRLDDGGSYVDWTGCGNTLDSDSTAVRRLVLESLVHWAEEYRIDGFRFDLAPAIGRIDGEYSPDSPLVRAIASEPRLAGLKLIAEPWDLGPGGYQRDGFPPPWRVWDDRFRDGVRACWRGVAADPAPLRRLLRGRLDAVEHQPFAERTIAYVSCHDGMTLADLVTYSQKHNHSNGHDNRDGARDERSSNWGVEGPTSEPEIAVARERAMRNLLATVLLSPACPMVGHGDELRRTQSGNSNPYSHDDETTWVDWSVAEEKRLVAFVRRLLELRRLLGAAGASCRVIERPDHPRLLAWSWEVSVDGGEEHETRREALICCNCGSRAAMTRLPTAPDGHGWRLLLTTHRPGAPPYPLPFRTLRLPAWSLTVLMVRAQSEDEEAAGS